MSNELNTLPEQGAKLAQTPTVFFADQLMQLAVGPHVAKLVFGSEHGIGHPPVPAFTVVMPTVQLKAMGMNILQFINQDDLKRQFIRDYQALIEQENASLGAPSA